MADFEIRFVMVTPIRRILLLAGTLIAVVVIWRIIFSGYKNLGERMNDKSIVYDNGLEVGVRKTLPVSLQEAWAFLVSPSGIDNWLGMRDFELSPGRSFQSDSVEGEVKVIKDLSHIRMVWKKAEWRSYSTLQIRVFRAEKGTTFSFHQERLSHEIVRKEMAKHWERVLEGVGEHFRLSEN